MNAIIVGMMPMLDFIDGNPLPPPVGDLDEQPLPPDSFVERCKASWGKFKVYVQGTTSYTIGHALSVVYSWYPTVELGVIDRGFPAEVEDDEADELQREAEQSAIVAPPPLRF
jgi:hypothetical protein